MSTAKPYLIVYVRQGCPACKKLLSVVSDLSMDRRLRVLVHDVSLLPPQTNGVGPTGVPVILHVDEYGTLPYAVYVGALPKEKLEALLS